MLVLYKIDYGNNEGEDCRYNDSLQYRVRDWVHTFIRC